MNDETKDLKSVLGDPKKAMIAMALPLFVSYLVAYIQNYIDSFWCSGLGVDVLSAISLSSTIYWIIVNIGVGFGVGSSAIIAKLLGAEKKETANSVASQSVILGIMLCILITIGLFAVSDPLFSLISGGKNTDLCKNYAMPFIVLCFPIIMNGIFLGLLRSEGAAKKASIVSISAAIFNMILDPIMIYGLNMGAFGASMATVISFALSTAIVVYWYYRKKMYIRLNFSKFRIESDQIYEILYVALPYTLSMNIISLMIIPENLIVLGFGGDNGIVTYYYPTRITNLALAPGRAIGAAVVVVMSAAIGQKDRLKVEELLRYSRKIGLLISATLVVIIFIFAEPLISTLTYSEEMIPLRDEMIRALRIYSPFIIAVCMMDLYSAVLQAMRHTQLTMVATIIMELFFIGFFLIATTISMDAIYWAYLFAQTGGAIAMIIFGKNVYKKTIRQLKSCSPI